MSDFSVLQSNAVNDSVRLLEVKLKEAEARRAREAELAKQDGEAFDDTSVPVTITVEEAAKLRAALFEAKEAIAAKTFDRDDTVTAFHQAAIQSYMEFEISLRKRADELVKCLEDGSTDLALLAIKDLPRLVSNPMEVFNKRVEAITAENARVDVVCAMVEIADRQELGWRSRIVIAEDADEAVGKAAAIFRAMEPTGNFGGFGLVEINALSRAEAASVVFQKVDEAGNGIN